MIAQLQADLAQHAGFGDKIAGGEGDRLVGDWISRRLCALGFDVHRQPVGVPVFRATACSLSAGDAVETVWPQPPVAATGPAGITAPLAVLRAPFEAADARGRIALLVLPHGRHASVQAPALASLASAAEAAGAVALVIVPTGPTGEVLGLNCDPDTPLSPLPTVVLAPARLEPFLVAARNGVPATLRVDGEPGRGNSDNLIASLRRGPRWLALSTPRTGWFGCASERGTGTAAFLALAGWAARVAPDHSIFALNSGAHEYLFAGARRAIELAPPPADTALWVHLGASLATRDRLEMRGNEQPLPSADPNRIVMASPDMLDHVAAAFAGLSGLERPQPVAQGTSELGAIASHGYRRCFAVLGMPKVFHSRQDTLDVVDAGLLEPVVQAHMAAIELGLQADAAARSGGVA
jgi:hypothetical protein